MKGGCHPQHWGATGWLCTALMCMVFFAITPDFQSPDEPDHIKRAYWLMEGHLWLSTPPGQSSGEQLDQGLNQYMSAYMWLKQSPQHVVTRQALESVKAIRWQHQTEFSAAPGTGYYFPLLYLPQGVGLYIGQVFDLTIHQSYQLARLLAILSCLALLAWAIRLYPLPPLAWAVLFLPMNLFQWSAASLDGLSTALTLVILSTFMRLWSLPRHEPLAIRLRALLLVSLFVLVATRIQMAPLFLMPLLLAWRDRKWADALWGLGVAAGVLVWLGSAVMATVDTRISGTLGAVATLQAYWHNPQALWNILANTLTSSALLNFYVISFIGMLGWLDIRLSDTTYYMLATGLLIVALCTAQYPCRDGKQRYGRLSLGVMSLSAVVLIFLALLLTWTPFPSDLIQGVQGRYFLMPALVMAYAVSADPAALSPWRRRVTLGGLGALLIIGMVASLQGLMMRYYMMP